MDIQDIRRAVMASHIQRAFRGIARQFALKVGKPEGQINDMLAGRKAFGEKVARAMATKLDLPPDYFDHLTNVDQDKIENFAAMRKSSEYKVDPAAMINAIVQQLDATYLAELLGAAKLLKYQQDKDTEKKNGSQ